MKLTVLNWLKDSSKNLIGRSIELLFRFILCILPLGLYMILLQKRSKASKVSSLMTFTNDRSVWQHIFPGFILVAIEPDVLNNFLTNLNNSFKVWVERNKYALAILFMSTIVSILILMYIKGGI
jgi:hypothetical protein